MTDTIASNEGAAGELAAALRGSLQGYLGFALCSLHPCAPVPGSSAHDGLSGSVRDALAKWEELVASDARALEGAAAELGGLDASLAGELLGVGGGPS